MWALPLGEAAPDNAKVRQVALPGSHWEDHLPLLPKMPVVHPSTGECLTLQRSDRSKREEGSWF